MSKLNGLKIIIIDGCRKFGSEAERDSWRSFEVDHQQMLANIPDLVIITSCASGAAAYDGRFTEKFLSRLQKLSKREMYYPLEAWLRRTMIELSSELPPDQRPFIHCDKLTGEWTLEDFLIPNGGNRKVTYPKTGGELKTWREEAVKMDRASFALEINRRVITLSDCEDNMPDKHLPGRLAEYVIPRYFSEDGQRHRNDLSDDVWDDFNDERPPVWGYLEQVKSQLNQAVTDEPFGVGRLALIDIRGQIELRRGRIWVASNEATAGREIGDRLLRRAVENFHDRARDKEGYFMRAERHEYSFIDDVTRLIYGCSAKAIELLEEKKNTEWFILFVSKNTSMNAQFEKKAHALCDSVLRVLQSAEMVVKS